MLQIIRHSTNMIIDRRYNLLSNTFALARPVKIAFLITIIMVTAFETAFSINVDELAQQIAESVSKVPGRKYANISFSSIKGNLDKPTVEQIIDQTRIETFKRRRFRVVARRQLQKILKEQAFNLSGLVSSQTYQKLGKILAVDLIVYGRYFGDSIVLKAIDVETSAIIWADSFKIPEKRGVTNSYRRLNADTETIQNLAQKTMNSIQGYLENLKRNGINQISFWNIKGPMDQEKLIDYLTVEITEKSNLQVVDRENLQLILQEQKLSLEDFIDEQSAKRMGELYGVDANIVGGIISDGNNHKASLELIDVSNSALVWADTIRFSGSLNSSDSFSSKTRTVSRRTTSRKSGQNRMMLIPEGDFIMGSQSGGLISSPSFITSLKAYYIDETEVSNSDYYTFVIRERHRPPRHWVGGRPPKGKEKEPVVMVNWEDANKYCLKQGKRLPREVEWEKAFRGSDGRKYPWKGDRFYPDYTRTKESGFNEPVDVDARTQDSSPYGVKHMAGNVREWVQSTLKPYPNSSYYSSKVQRRYKVVRGGSWDKPSSYSVGWFRDSLDKVAGALDIGFRCAKPK